MTGVRITKNNEKITVESPYHPSFPPAARKLGGKWNGGAWVFDVRDEMRVRELCIEIYGTDGEVGAGDLVTVRVEFIEECHKCTGGVFLCGRMIARAFGRDSGAKIGDGIVFVEGSPRSGGSVKNWRTIIPANSVIEIRDVPRPAAEACLEQLALHPDAYKAEIVGESIDHDALIAERERLMQRIAEIDALLEKANSLVSA